MLKAVVPLSLALVALVLAVGVFLPYLFSAKSTLAVLFGLFLAITGLVLAFSLGLYGLWRLTKLMQKIVMEDW
jgi:hypothetical protein